MTTSRSVNFSNRADKIERVTIKWKKVEPSFNNEPSYTFVQEQIKENSNRKVSEKEIDPILDETLVRDRANHSVQASRQDMAKESINSLYVWQQGSMNFSAIPKRKEELVTAGHPLFDEYISKMTRYKRSLESRKSLPSDIQYEKKSKIHINQSPKKAYFK